MSRISFLDASLPEDTAVIVDGSKLIADGVAQLLSERRTTRQSVQPIQHIISRNATCHLRI